MEAERRSTMSSLKGQLSNVEGSVKSMKVAVVVGSVLTVACLAAVFGVTVLANEVSKEVKVSNGELTAKSGEMVKTANKVFTQKIGMFTETVVFNGMAQEEVTAKVNVVFQAGEQTVFVGEGLTVTVANGQTAVNVAEGSLLAQAMDNSAESRSLNPAKVIAGVAAAKAIGGVVGGLTAAYIGIEFSEEIDAGAQAVSDWISDFF